jgi:hypothetical protein
MNKIKQFNQFINESTTTSIGDRFEELVDDKYDEVGQAIKIENRNREGDITELGTIKAQLKEEYPNVFKIECDFTSFYGSDKYDVTLRSFNTEKDFEDQDPTDYKVVKVSIPSDDDDW